MLLKIPAQVWATKKMFNEPVFGYCRLLAEMP